MRGESVDSPWAWRFLKDLERDNKVFQFVVKTRLDPFDKLAQTEENTFPALWEWMPLRYSHFVNLQTSIILLSHIYIMTVLGCGWPRSF